MNFILIVSQKHDPHVELVTQKLQNRKAHFLRFNTEEFPKNASISFSLNGTREIHLLTKDFRVNLNLIKSVWLRRPASSTLESNRFINSNAYKFALRECAELINGIWRVSNSYWVSKPHKIKMAENKVYQLDTARKIGFKIPNLLVTNDPSAVKQFIINLSKRNKEAVIKPLHTVAIQKGNKLFGNYTRKITLADIPNKASIQLTPCFIQEYINKQIELRITVVGNRVFAAEIHSQSSEKTKIDWRRYDFDNVTHCKHMLPSSIQTHCISLVKKLGLAFGAIDMILTPKNEYVFLEINPNGQWGWIEMLTKLPISDAIANLLINAKLD